MSLSHHLSHSLCSFLLFSDVVDITGNYRSQRLLQDGCACCHVWDRCPNPGYFSLLGSFCVSFRELATPSGVLYVRWYLGCIFMISPWFIQQSPHVASLLFIIWSQFSFNTGQSLLKTLLHLPYDFEKLSAFSVLNSGGTRLFLHSVPFTCEFKVVWTSLPPLSLLRWESGTSLSTLQTRRDSGQISYKLSYHTPESSISIRTLRMPS